MTKQGEKAPASAPASTSASRGLARHPVWATALRVWGYTLLVGLMGLLFAPLLMSETAALRVALNLVVLALAMMLVWMDGANRGERACGAGDLLKKSGQALTGDDRLRTYSLPRALAGAGLAALPWVALGVAVAATARPETYTLQDLPSYLTPYRALPEVGSALQYYNRAAQPVSPMTWVRLVVRFVQLPVTYMLGGADGAGTVLADRVSPLAALLLPGAYAVGYAAGPARYRKSQAYIREAVSKPRKRLKKQAQAKRRRDDTPERLI